MGTNKTDTCWLWEGVITAQGYGHLYADGFMVGVHRLSYVRHKGGIPDGMDVDHICHKRHCLNPGHLRLATRGENMQNPSGVRSDNSTGYVGVSYYKARDKYTAYINLNGKRVYLGYFLTAEDAWEARKAKELEMFTHSPLVSVVD